MATQKKITFLMETIPSEEAVLELRKRYLFGPLEAELLKEASRALHASSPDSRLIDWAYELLQLHIARNAAKKEKELPMQEKMERIIALFSNPEDLQSLLRAEDWSPSDKRAIQLVSHFVANEIPLASNVKIVDKVYRLLENASLPPSIAARYFGRSGSDAQRERILEKYRTYRDNRAERQSAPPSPPEREHPLKRYIYILGASAVVVAIFMAGFVTARLLYGGGAQAELSRAAMESILHPSPKPEKEGKTQNRAVDDGHEALENRLAVSRVLLQEGLEKYDTLQRKVDFACRVVGGAVADALPTRRGTKGEAGDERAPRALRRSLPHPLPRGALKVAIEGIAQLQGLRLPARPEEANLSLDIPVPEGFRLHAEETPQRRTLYLSDGKSAYPLEVYSFVAEPTILRYRLINYEPKHYMPVVSDIWHFSDIGELRTHKHFVYRNGRISPAKIITNHFLPGGETLEMVSVGKLGRDGRPAELPLRRRDFLPNAKLLYDETHELDRLDGTWRSRTVRQVWYDEGKKIYAKGTR